MKRKNRVQVIVLILIGLVCFFLIGRSEFVPESSDEYSLRALRETLAEELDRVEIFDKGYVTLLVGWALLHHGGSGSVGHLIDAVVDDQLPTLAVFFAEDRKSFYNQEIAKLEVTRNPENYRIWKLVQPKNCHDILPLYLNTKTGSFICGDASTATIELWRRGLPHLSFSLFSGPALALDPTTWTSKQWIKYIFQGVTR